MWAMKSGLSNVLNMVASRPLTVIFSISAGMSMT